MSFRGKASGEIKGQAGVVLEAEVGTLAAWLGEELDLLDNAAPELRKMDFLGALEMTTGGSRIVGLRGAADLVPSFGGIVISMYLPIFTLVSQLSK